MPRTVGLDERRLIDCDQEGRVLGVECRNVGAGISLERVPDGDELATVIAELAPNLRTLLPPNASSAG